jgi:tRNA nucleotidyltransferase/poly(A) polymerase
MSRKKRFRVRFEFTKRPDAGKNIQEARGILFKLKEGGTAETDFGQEARYLAAVLKLMFPVQTLAFLKDLLPGS